MKKKYREEIELHAERKHARKNNKARKPRAAASYHIARLARVAVFLCFIRFFFLFLSFALGAFFFPYKQKEMKFYD